MTPLDRLGGHSSRGGASARVGDIVASLLDTGRQHTLVIEKDDQGNPVVCGIFSLTQIEKQLGVAIPSTEIARTFTEIEATLARGVARVTCVAGGKAVTATRGSGWITAFTLREPTCYFAFPFPTTLRVRRLSVGAKVKNGLIFLALIRSYSFSTDHRKARNPVSLLRLPGNFIMCAAGRRRYTSSCRRSMHTPTFFTPRIALSLATLIFTQGDLNSVRIFARHVRPVLRAVRNVYGQAFPGRVDDKRIVQRILKMIRITSPA